MINCRRPQSRQTSGNLGFRIETFSNMMRSVLIAKVKVKLYLGATYSPKVFLAGPKYEQEGSDKSGAPVKSGDVHKLFIQSITHIH